uniref:Putative secreted salivary protein n=1 Tax=Xenopsylla cheopis TaxID=163159 RepID=A2IAC1_XENCH|nr:putative secreted salivary protein [Xenopsylla cheopis]
MSLKLILIYCIVILNIYYASAGTSGFGAVGAIGGIAGATSGSHVSYPGEKDSIESIGAGITLTPEQKKRAAENLKKRQEKENKNGPRTISFK